MSYKETEKTLKRLLDKLESLEAEFLVERDVYKESFKQDLAAAKNVVKKLDEGNWHFDMNGLMKIEITHKNDRGLYEDTTTGGANRWFEIAPGRELLPFKELKKVIVGGIFRLIQDNEDIQQLEHLKDVTLRDAETAENKITESFYEELSDILNPGYESYRALEAMWNKVAPTVSVYQEKVIALFEQASKEWLDEGYLGKGDLVTTATFFTDKVCKVEKIENGIIYTDTGERWKISDLHPSVVEFLWKINHPQFKVDDLVTPLDSVADWRLAEQA